MAERLRSIPQKPLNIVCCFIVDDTNRILLLRRHSKALGGGLWATPGGKQEPGEPASVTAIREVKEETGLAVPHVQYLGKHELRMPHGVVFMKTYTACIDGTRTITIDTKEHEDYRWFAIQDVLNQEKIIWGLPTTLLDFGFLDSLDVDPTLADGSQAILIETSAAEH